MAPFSLRRSEGDRAVAFLDAPGLDADALFAAVADVLAEMPPGAILTVFTDDPAARRAAGEWCVGHDVELLAIIRHDDHGATLAVRLPGDPADGASTGRSAAPTDPPRDLRPPSKT